MPFVNGLMNGVMWALCWCAVPAVGAAPADRGAESTKRSVMPPGPQAERESALAAEITQISLEQDCSGCATGSVLVIRRDGSVSFTVQGKSRLGGVSRQEAGRVNAQDFSALARLIVAQGYFEMNDEYQNPELQDGAWAVTRVSRNGQEKQVFRRDDAAPAALTAIERALSELKARIRFTPVAS